MNTGSLKFVSLLLVIAVGGGVVWQIQQRLKEAGAETADAAGDDSADTADEELPPIESDFDEPPEFSSEPPRRLAAADWDDGYSDDTDPDNTYSDNAGVDETPPAAPGKFERKTPQRKRRETAIPSRRSSLHGVGSERDVDSPREVAGRTETEFSGGDPFGEQADPAAAESDRPTFAENEDISPATDDAMDIGANEANGANDQDELLAAEPADEPESDSEASMDAVGSDPFGDTSPVLLVGKNEKEPPSKLEFEPESATETETNADAETDDPFAGSAPPDFGEVPVEDPAPKRPARHAPKASEEPKERSRQNAVSQPSRNRSRRAVEAPKIRCRRPMPIRRCRRRSNRSRKNSLIFRRRKNRRRTSGCRPRLSTRVPVRVGIPSTMNPTKRLRDLADRTPNTRRIRRLKTRRRGCCRSQNR